MSETSTFRKERDQRFKRDRRFKQIVSLFIFVSMGLVLGILWLGNATSNPFGAKYFLQMELVHAGGLKKDTPVTLAGIMVGNVSDLQLTDNNKIRVTLCLFKKYMEKIRDDSVVTLIKPYFGRASLDISLGSSETAVLQNNQLIQFDKTNDINDVFVQLPETLAHVDTILANMKTFTEQLLDPDGHFQKGLLHADGALVDLSRMTNQVEKTALDGQKTLSDAQKTVQLAQPLAEQLRSLLEKGNQMAVDLAKVSEQLAKASPEIPVFVNHGRDVMQEAEALMHRVNHFVPLGLLDTKDGSDGRLTYTPRDLPMIQTPITP